MLLFVKLSSSFAIIIREVYFHFINQKIYWYYKLQAQEPTFPKAQDESALSKYKHLGKAGSEAHITAVMQVVRRSQIDEIQRTIDTLTQALLDVGYDDEPQKK